MSKAKTELELREQVLETIRSIAAYWADLPDKSDRERCDGLAFSVLSMFDGCTIGLPSFDIVARPHEDDKAYCQDSGEDWIEDGTLINSDVLLHEFWHEQPIVASECEGDADDTR